MRRSAPSVGAGSRLSSIATPRSPGAWPSAWPPEEQRSSTTSPSPRFSSASPPRVGTVRPRIVGRGGGPRPFRPRRCFAGAAARSKPLVRPPSRAERTRARVRTPSPTTASAAPGGVGQRPRVRVACFAACCCSQESTISSSSRGPRRPTRGPGASAAVAWPRLVAGEERKSPRLARVPGRTPRGASPPEGSGVRTEIARRNQ